MRTKDHHARKRSPWLALTLAVMGAGGAAALLLLPWKQEIHGGTSPQHHEPRRLPPKWPLLAVPESVKRYQEVAAELDPALLAIPNARNITMRNPCWNRQGGSLACLPHFLILGGYQSAALSLYTTLTGHGEVAQGHEPRSHFWTNKDMSVEAYLTLLAPSIPELELRPKRTIMGDASEGVFAYTWYAGRRAHRAYSAAAEQCTAKCAEKQKRSVGASGGGGGAEAECAVVCADHARRADDAIARKARLPREAVALPLLVRAAYGPTPPKLVVLLRDPVERLHSAFWRYSEYQQRYSATREGFLAYAQEAVAAFEECAGRQGERSARECALFFETLGPQQDAVFKHADQLLRGLYWVWLEGWMSHFPPHHLHVVLTEDYLASPRKTLDGVCAFLGIVPPVDNQLWADMVASERHTPSNTAKREMLPEARRLLQRFYRPHDERLGQLLGLGAVSPWTSSR